LFNIAHICTKFGTCISLEVLHAGICQNIKQKYNPKWRRPPSYIFAQTAITRPPIDVDERNFAAMSTAVTENRQFDQNGQK